MLKQTSFPPSNLFSSQATVPPIWIRNKGKRRSVSIRVSNLSFFRAISLGETKFPANSFFRSIDRSNDQERNEKSRGISLVKSTRKERDEKEAREKNRRKSIVHPRERDTTCQPSNIPFHGESVQEKCKRVGRHGVSNDSPASVKKGGYILPPTLPRTRL